MFKKKIEIVGSFKKGYLNLVSMPRSRHQQVTARSSRNADPRVQKSSAGSIVTSRRASIVVLKRILARPAPLLNPPTRSRSQKLLY